MTSFSRHFHASTPTTVRFSTGWDVCETSTVTQLRLMHGTTDCPPGQRSQSLVRHHDVHPLAEDDEAVDIDPNARRCRVARAQHAYLHRVRPRRESVRCDDDLTSQSTRTIQVGSRDERAIDAHLGPSASRPTWRDPCDGLTRKGEGRGRPSRSRYGIGEMRCRSRSVVMGYGAMAWLRNRLTQQVAEMVFTRSVWSI